jgi:ATP-dependent Clp endopeptidase proteolytic subunit ClpP
MKHIKWLTEPPSEDKPTEKQEEAQQPIIILGDDSEINDVVDGYSNTIYFYSEVKRTEILKLNKCITQLSDKLIHHAHTLRMPAPPPIYLHINSYGGSIFAGMSALDYIKASKVPVHTTVDGCAASAATLMSIVGAHRSIQKNSHMMIHQLSSMNWGTFEQIKDDIKNSELLMKKIKEIYSEHTKIPKRKLSQLLKHDLWWDAETCLKYGMVDEIV